ncbi:hypothetical protein KVR01_009440 [Diaporthe batatas]|uniref:uncharacterized protein n=1 Tax=Diaporthe batatas TaxID=748121 RepID=UPI001D03FF8E|nr:uncharacterized protein KVR01_009440 [Diaporthe batatas]KAG8161176.1 hypothetical protein KVR01_009440 [Diaporthe batatas]
MRSYAILPLAVAASAFVVPDIETFSQLPVHGQAPHHDDSSWQDWFPSADSISSSIHDVVDPLASSAEETFHSLKGKLQREIESVFDEDASSAVEEFAADDEDASWDKPRRGGHHGKSNLTIYQLISESKYTTKFAALVDEHEDIVKLLNSTEANYTLFVPVDSAFEHIPKHKKPSKEFVESVLRYHIGLGLYPAGRVLVTHTLPTALDEPLLGNQPQRLRTSVGLLSGVRVNFYSKVVAVDIGAKNGVIHAVKSLLVPPPFVGRELSLFPGRFSTLLLAFDKTDFTSFIHGQVLNGSTIFAPDNRAFQKLGPAANAFLFNTEAGLGYLKAILKYHVVANETVYSDAYYSSGSGSGSGSGSSDDSNLKTTDDVGRGHYHLDLPTLLGDKRIAVDVARWAGFIRVKINGYIPITVQDGIAKNGVIHVPASVLIPPHKKHGREGGPAATGEISVEELKERLAGYVEGEDEGQGGGGAQVESEL